MKVDDGGGLKGERVKGETTADKNSWPVRVTISLCRRSFDIGVLMTPRKG